LRELFKVVLLDSLANSRSGLVFALCLDPVPRIAMLIVA
jgi:hypothetical protein